LVMLISRHAGPHPTRSDVTASEVTFPDLSSGDRHESGSVATQSRQSHIEVYRYHAASHLQPLIMLASRMISLRTSSRTSQSDLRLYPAKWVMFFTEMQSSLDAKRQVKLK